MKKLKLNPIAFLKRLIYGENTDIEGLMFGICLVVGLFVIVYHLVPYIQHYYSK